MILRGMSVDVCSVNPDLQHSFSFDLEDRPSELDNEYNQNTFQSRYRDILIIIIWPGNQ